MSTKIAGAEHQVIAGAGHACCLEDPAAFDRIVMRFLEKNGFV
jgi:pimeloyl-ACP methyl ester carboxylesterase